MKLKWLKKESNVFNLCMFDLHVIYGLLREWAKQINSVLWLATWAGMMELYVARLWLLTVSC